jgi:hypothetical protein
MSTIDAQILSLLPIISLYLNRIVPILQLIIGTFGNIMNILIFTRRSLRTNPCSFYFLILSINNLFVLYVALLTRLLSSGWNIDPSNTNIVLCKLRIFFVYSSLCLIQWFVVLASIDRYLCSSHSARLRHLSTLSLAKQIICITVLIIFLAHFHTLVWWTIDYIGPSLYCNIFSDDYDLAFQIFFLISTCILPPILMAIFGILTILNVKKLRVQVTPTTNLARNERSRSKDRQLITMLLVQVLVTIIFTAPFAAVNLNDMIVENMKLSDRAVTITTFFDNVARILLYFNPMVGFFVYTLAGKTFRNELKVMTINAIRRIS